MKKNEIVLLVCLFVAAVLGILSFYLLNTSDKPLSARVTRDGAVLDVFPLAEDYTQTFADASGLNTLVIVDGKAEISIADCPDQICVQHYPISTPGETLVCLPHKLVVEIVPGDS